MLVTRRAHRLCLVTHPEHARLAGELARRWGNERFQAPAPAAAAALVIAAAHHDDGWDELDRVPAFNSEQGRPAHFLELPLEQTVGPYGRGVERVYAHDPHAGALVSMHWAGLYSTRWGLQGGEPVPHPLAVEVVAEQERRWVSALREAWGGRGLRSAFEHQSWYAYELLQALDVISLGLGLVDLEHPSPDDEPVPLVGMLSRVDQPAGPRTISDVPVAPGEGYLELTMRVTAPGVVTIDPYPFSEAGFELELNLRRIEDRRYASAEEAARAYRDAPPDAIMIVVNEP
jgi:hypothetical protein